MLIKLFELRDTATCIPVMAIWYSDETDYTNTKIPNWGARIKGIMGRAGFYRGGPYVLLIKLNTCECQYDPFHWKLGRVMRDCHLYIQNNWDALVDGQVIDIRYLAGETSTPATPDCYEN